MKCTARLHDNCERKEECEKEAIFSITFHNGVVAHICAEHNEMAKTIEHLIVGRKEIQPYHTNVIPAVWEKIING